MEADYGSNYSKIEKMGHLSVPPGFASLTSFCLKRGTTFPTASEQEPIHMETKSEIYTHRPWILLDQSNRKPAESHTEHLPMVKLGICKKNLMIKLLINSN